jgi:hypothetical protein
MITDRQIALMMFLNLQKQAYEWQWVIKNSNLNEAKNQFRIAHQANTKLIDLLEKEILKEPETAEQYYDISEKFSRALEKIINAPTPQLKQELVELLIAWVDGSVHVVEDENSVKKSA